MNAILVASDSGCRVFAASSEEQMELAGHPIGALYAEPAGSCLAIVDQREIWRRAPTGEWTLAASANIALQSLTSVGETIFAGGMEEPILLRSSKASMERLTGFDHTAGREEWFAGGPPLGVRSLAASSSGPTIFAAVHVGGIPRSIDRGANWIPTIPVKWDVHEVRVHLSLPDLVAAATAVGLAVSQDAGESWKLLAEGPPFANSLAVAALSGEILFSIEDGPFATQSQLWRWPLGSDHLEQVRDGLPEWLEGKVDTGGIAAAADRAAVLDGGGNLWLSRSGSTGWERLATGLGYSFGLAIV